MVCGVAVAQAPDLHETAIKPATLANHETTKVTKDGSNLGNATITADGACTLVSYTTTDDAITMVLKAERALNADPYCNFHVKNAHGAASSWILVDYTEDEQRQIDANTRAGGEKNAADVKARSGNEWTLRFGEGGKVTYKLRPIEGEPGVAVFADNSGHEVKIMVANDTTVLIVPTEGGCYRTGKLVDGRVTNGTSGLDCKPGGNWTAEMR